MTSFPASIQEQLGYYVYIYIDPRTKDIFYVGKGCNNRAFLHLQRNDESRVATRIAEIRADGYEPKIEILAHGFQDAETALRVEAAAIDLWGRERLLNEIGGWESREFGRYPVEEIAALYCQTPVNILKKDPVLLVRINQLYYADMPSEELYEITRGVWRLSIERACNVRYVFAVFNNVVREVYEAVGWFPAGATGYFKRAPEDVEAPDRIEFVGRIASEEVRNRYLFKSVSDYFVKGNSNPVQYVNC